MRILEAALAVILALQMLVPILVGQPLGSLAIISTLVMLAQLLVEGYRWQMLPLYALTLLFLALQVRGWLSYTKPSSGKALRAFLSLFGLLLVIVAAALPVIFPIAELPKPTGPNQVGTFSTMLVDSGRKEIYSGDPNEPRRLMVQFWYPAQPAAGARTGLWIEHPEIVGPSISKWLGFPSFMLDHLVYAHSHSYPDAPLSSVAPRYPVIFFSHGWNGIRTQSTFLMEELASQGYVVVSIDHTYGARVVVFPDGKVAENNPAALPSEASLDILVPAAHKLVDQWASDISFVLDTLAQWDQNDPSGRFTGRLDLDKVGVSGHSTGGGAAIEFCSRDPRCKAGVGLDAYMTPVSDAALDSGVQQPFLFLFSVKFPTQRNTELFGRLLSHSAHAREITITGTAHYDFSDLPLLSPLAPYLGLKGPLNAGRVLSLDRTLTLALFDQALRGGSGQVLSGPSPDFPELQFDYLP